MGVGPNNLIGGLSQGLAQGFMQGQRLRDVQIQQQSILEMQKLQKQQMDLEHKREQLKAQMFPDLTLEEKKQAMFGIKPPDALETAIISEMFGGGPGASVAPMSSSAPPMTRGTVSPELIKYAAEYHGVPAEIAQAVIQAESGGRTNAVSPAGAIGPAQLMPGTAADLGANPQDPYQNIMGGMRYLAEQKQRFGGWPQALAAYNTGPETVAQKGVTPAGARYLTSVQAAIPRGQQPTLFGLTKDDIGRGLIKRKVGAEPTKLETVRNVEGPDGRPYTVPFDPITGEYKWDRAVPQSVELKPITQTGSEGQQQTIFKSPYDTTPVQTQGPKAVPTADAGQIKLTQNGLEMWNRALGMVYDEKGNVNRKNLFNAAMPFGGTPGSEGRELEGTMEGAIKTIIYAASGKAVTESEMVSFRRQYMPSLLDSDKQIKAKMEALGNFLNGYLELVDPSGAVRLRAGEPVDINKLYKVKPGEKVKVEQPKRMTYDPATGTFK